MDDKPSHHIADGTNDPAANYSLVSAIAHWLGALAVIALFLTHEDDWIALHVSIGIVLFIPLLTRVYYRFAIGFPRPVDQHPAFNLLARLVMIGMLLAILVTTITGILIPLFAGDPYVILDAVRWTAPYRGNIFVYELLEEAHDFAGHAIVPLFILHLIGFSKHFVFNKQGNRLRMLKSLKGGK